MHEQHYVFPTNFIYFNHVCKSFKSLYNENLKKNHEIFQRRGLEMFQNFHVIFKYFKVKYFIASCIPTPAPEWKSATGKMMSSCTLSFNLDEVLIHTSDSGRLHQRQINSNAVNSIWRNYHYRWRRVNEYTYKGVLIKVWLMNVCGNLYRRLSHRPTLTFTKHQRRPWRFCRPILSRRLGAGTLERNFIRTKSVSVMVFVLARFRSNGPPPSTRQWMGYFTATRYTCTMYRIVHRGL